MTMPPSFKHHFNPSLLPISSQPNSFLLNLPMELVLEILTRLSVPDMGAYSLTCKAVNQWVKQDWIWENLLSRDFPFYRGIEKVENFEKRYQECHTFHSNIAKGKFASRILEGHLGSIMSFITANETLISGSSDKTIKIWDLKKGICTATLQGHEAAVTALIIIDGNLISGSSDHTIKIWNLKEGACITTLMGHTNAVSSFVIAEGYLVSSSWDKTIKVWDANTGICIKTLVGHKESVTSLVSANRILVSGSCDNTIKVWDLKLDSCVKTLEVSSYGKDFIRSLFIAGGKLFSGSNEGVIKIWDLEKSQCIATLHQHKRSVNAFVVEGGRLFSASSDNQIKVWDLGSSSPTSTLTGRRWYKMGPFTTYNKMLIAGYSTGMIKVWDFATNRQRLTSWKDPEKEDRYHLLEHLGIVTSQDYCEKLLCRPEYLQKVGLLSHKDIKIICNGSSDLQMLPFAKEETIMVRRKKGRAKALSLLEQRNDNLYSLSKRLLTAVRIRINETKKWRVLSYKSECPWLPLQRDVNSFHQNLKMILNGDDSSFEQTTALFNSFTYNFLATKVNEMVIRFHCIDKEHQVDRLCAYLNQRNILHTWKRFHRFRIESLSRYQEIMEGIPGHLFRMGE